VKLPTVSAALLCEDIRQEMTGKFSLAGVFASDLMTPNFAAPMTCGVFAEVIAEEAGKLHVEFRVTDGDGKLFTAGEIQTFFVTPGKQPFVFGPFQFTAAGYGPIRFQWRLHGRKQARWVTVKSFDLRPIPQTIPGQLPDALKNFLSQIAAQKQPDAQ
jgi:hypothetical protein